MLHILDVALRIEYDLMHRKSQFAIYFERHVIQTFPKGAKF